jgi:two-component system, cell cycle sensor histidine kinase and response regulator CckA
MSSLSNKDHESILNKIRAEAQKTTKRTGTSAGRKERILVMDDDAVIRGIIRSMLSESGYEIKVAEHGIQAIQYFAEAKDAGSPFDAVILDLNVPSGMGGDKALERLRVIDPGVKAILLTGDSCHPAMSHYTILGFKTAIIKPFILDDLLQAIHRASDS